MISKIIFRNCCIGWLKQALFAIITCKVQSMRILTKSDKDLYAMKKLTFKYKKWLLNRIRKSAKTKFQKNLLPKQNKIRTAHQVTLWSGGKSEKAISVRRPTIPPSNFCFRDNLTSTLEFIANWREQLHTNSRNAKSTWVKRSKKHGRLPRINGYTDFSKIDYISTAAAVVLAAEYERMKVILKGVPPTVNLKSWSENLFRKLFQLGFFEIVGLASGLEDSISTDGDVKSMRIVSGTNATELEEACNNIRELSKFIDQQGPMDQRVSVALNSALSEAMINVSRHAYEEIHKFQYRHVGKWWVTASANRKNRVLTIVIYDQGASIPVTFPNKNWSQAVRDFLSNAINSTPEFDFQNDSAYIEGAMRPGNTQTDEVNRGLGLPEMKDLVDICGTGRLTIYSRGGVVSYKPGADTQILSHPHSIGGTLIEWILRLPESTEHDQ